MNAEKKKQVLEILDRLSDTFNEMLKHTKEVQSNLKDHKIEGKKIK